MGIDSSIYSLLDTKGLQSGLAGIGDAYTQGVEQKNRLSQLSMEKEKFDMAKAQAVEQKKQKDMQELNSSLAFGIQQKNGISNQDLMNSTYDEAIRRGLKDEDVAKLFQPWASVANQTDGAVVQPTAQEQQGVADIYAQRANQQEAIKQRLVAMNRKPEKDTLISPLKVEKFTPESLSVFQKTKDYGDLVQDPNSSSGSGGFYNVLGIDPSDPNGTAQNFTLNKGTGKYTASGIKAPNYDPQTKQAIAGAAETGKDTAKRTFNMAGIGGVIQQADDLLSGIERDGNGVIIKNNAPIPTASGAGSIYDAAAGFVGASPEGADQAQQLRAVGGALTSKMPRMEGPQSDADTKLYREMAGLVQDSSIPISRRKAALKVVKDLWSKYEGQQEQPTRRASDSSKRIKFDAQGNMVQ